MVVMVSHLLEAPNRNQAAPDFRIARQRYVLEAINERRIAIAAWRRRLPAVLDAWFRAQESDHLLELGLVARPKVLEDELRQAADAIGVLPGLGRRAFLGDVAELAHDVARIADAPSVDVRLSVVPVAALNGELLDQDGLRLLAVYHTAPAPHPQTKGEAEGWQLAGRGATMHLERASVLMLKGRPKDARRHHASLQWMARGDAAAAQGCIYVLEIRP